MKIQHLRQIQLLFILFISQVSFSQEALSLDDCLARVRAAAPDLRQLDVADALSELHQKINGTNYLPQLGVNGQASWQSDVTSFDVEFPGVDIPFPSKDQYRFTLDLVQPIYDGGATRAQNVVVQQETALTQAKYSGGIQMTEDMATELFYQIAMQEQLLGSADLQIERFNRVIQSLENNLAGGVISKQDVLAARVRLKEAAQKRNEASDNKRKAQASLAILMGDPSMIFDIQTGTSSMPDTAVLTFDTRPEIQALNAQTQVLQASDRLSRTQYHPRLSAFATGGYGKPGLNFVNSTFDTYLIAGLSLTVPLSQVYSRKSSREAQVFQLQQEDVQLSKEKTLRNFQIQAAQYLAEINKLTTWLADDAEIVSMRTTLVDVAKARQEEGTITMTDYLNELTDLSLAEDQQAIHTVMLEHTYALLSHLTGN